MVRIRPEFSLCLGVVFVLVCLWVVPAYAGETPGVDPGTEDVVLEEQGGTEVTDLEVATTLASDLACGTETFPTLFPSIFPEERGSGLCGAPPACNRACTSDLYCKRCCNEADQLSICHPSGCCLC